MQVVPNSLVEGTRHWGGGPVQSSDEQLPEGAADYLRRDNPRLAELRRRYEGHPVAANQTLWSADYIDANLEMSRFRADSAYRWQTKPGVVKGANNEMQRVPTREVNYAVSAQYVQANDRLGLLERLKDDGHFGNCVVEFDGSLVSTDLLDSVLQLDFLDRHIGLDVLRSQSVLDIGAGYGRFAHRLAEAVPDLRRIVCVDAVAESTFLCEYYLRFRGVDTIADVVPLDAIDDDIAPGEITLAVNMHSFPEIPLSSVEWWLAFLARKQVRYLMIVPNAFNRTACESDGSRPSFEPSLDAAGYELIVEEPKYRSDSAQRHAVYPGEHLLYELRTS